MRSKESICAELGHYLSDIIPVAWNTIIFYADRGLGWGNWWFAYREKETDRVITLDNFFRRYDSYPITKMDLISTMGDFIIELSDIAEMPNGYKWNYLKLVIFGDKSISFDFRDQELPNSSYQNRKNLIREIFDSDYDIQIKGKYPSLE